MLDHTLVMLVVSDFDGEPGEITRLIGCRPTEAWCRGEQIKGGGAMEDSQWRLHSPLGRKSSVGEQLEALTAKLEPYAAGIRNCATRFRTHIRCAIFFAKIQAQFQLPESALQRVSRLGLSLEFDVYFSSGDSGFDDSV